MEELDKSIIVCDKVICDNIKKFDSTERGLLSQNILSNLRNLLEAINLKIYSNSHIAEVHNYSDIENANAYVNSRGELRFLKKFHDFLQASVSHYTPDEENSERLMLKYYFYLIKTKIYVKSKLGLDILDNIADFPTNNDSRLSEYYEKIAEQIDKVRKYSGLASNRYYVYKSKPFFVNHKIYYENTLTLANDKASKFDRFIAFSENEIPSYYAIKISYIEKDIDILKRKMPIKIINDFQVSIRPCELKKLELIFSPMPKISTGNKEYYALMEYLTKTGFSLLDIVDFQKKYYDQLKSDISKDGKTTYIFDILDKCRDLSEKQTNGVNIVRYLLLNLHNQTIKDQLDIRDNNWLSYLYLKNESKPFDCMPFATSLSNHNPTLSDVFECINIKNRDYELLARKIKDNTEFKGQLYTPISELSKFEDINNAICTFNNKLCGKHKMFRSLMLSNNNIYIYGYEAETIDIINQIKNISKVGIQGYTNSVEFWLKNNPNILADDEKKNIMRTMFESSSVALIYGSAGTGKSTLISHISSFFSEQQKLFLANTNPAVENLRRKVKVQNSIFKTIAKVINCRNISSCDILFVDECSTVSNSDMLRVLNSVKYKVLVLVGDVYQIESITFGNWFHLAKSFIPKESVYELTNTYRTTDNHLLELWDKVRKLDDKIIEFITAYDYSKTIDDSIFVPNEEDEIILCLNYDGLYGINNANRFLQNNNPNPFFEWGIWRYKVDDPIIFNENNRFAPLIYNNLKGWIRKIEIIKDSIWFNIEIDTAVNALDIGELDLNLIENLENGHSVIRFSVNKYHDNDEDDDVYANNVVPFQIAYAISIHKAQGLEYDSVKVVITNEIEELISHNIFYTAITRAKKKLKIYWTPETENKIISNMKYLFNTKDANIIAIKNGWKMEKN